MRAGRVLWLGHLERRGRLPVRVFDAAGPAAGGGAAAEDGGPAAAAEGGGAETALSLAPTAHVLLESAEPLENGWTAAPQGGAWRMLGRAYLGCKELQLPFKVSEALGLSKGRQLVREVVKLADPAGRRPGLELTVRSCAVNGRPAGFRLGVSGGSSRPQQQGGWPEQ